MQDPCFNCCELVTQGAVDTDEVTQTGWRQATDRQCSRDAGVDHHIVKPIDPDMLMC